MQSRHPAIATARAWFAANRPYGFMLAADALIWPLVLLSRLHSSVPQNPYSHLLVTYDNGLIKRALLGEIVSWFAPQVPAAALYGIGLAAWSVALALYLAVFRRTMGFASRPALALLCFTAGSPFFFKNFMHAIGFLDVYGAIVAMLALLLPLSALASVALTLLAAALLLLHHIHFLLYLPTIAFIWLLRLYARRDPGRAEWLAVGFAAAALCLVFVLVMFAGAPPIAPERFLEIIRARALIPVDSVVLKIWYSTLSGELAQTWGYLPAQLLRLPVFALLLALHLPFWRALRAALKVLPESRRRSAVVGLAAITAGYGVICVTNYDWSRWFSSWFVCMALCFHAARSAAPERAARSLDPDNKRTRLLALAVTAVPRIGVVFPF